jgi:hypothetical protein
VGTPAGPKSITSTADHLFWDATTHAWTNATDLKLGDQLNTPGDGHATVLTLRRYVATIRTYNLTIDTIHTYYVIAGETPVLVHNTSAACGSGRSPWQLTQDGASAMKRGGPFNTTFYKSSSDRTWWTPDTAGHGGTAFKVYEETKRGLQWIADADQYGNYIVGKWKGDTGYFIPNSNLRGAG